MAVDIKKAQEQLNALYKNYDYMNDSNNDKKLLMNEAKSYINRDLSLSFKSKEQAHEIFWRCWDKDRGEQLYTDLANEYKVSREGIVNLVRGHVNKAHALCPVDYKTLKKMKKEWKEKYQSYQIIVETPGCDLLERYDQLYKNTQHYQKVNEAWKLTLPSVVYHCRFNLENPTPQSVRDYCDRIGIPRLKNDLGQYKKILDDTFMFLTTETSKTYHFNSYKSLANFFNSHDTNVGWNEHNSSEKVLKGWVPRKTTFSGWIFTIIKGEEIEP